MIVKSRVMLNGMESLIWLQDARVLIDFAVERNGDDRIHLLTFAFYALYYLGIALPPTSAYTSRLSVDRRRG